MKEESKFKEPLLSVCLITYNHAKYIRDAIEGVLMQQVNFEFDLVIADDCSTDGTREILLEYQSRYPNFIKLILQNRNVGPAVNWLELVNFPQTKYIAYVDGDDYWTDSQKLQTQVDFLEANPTYSACFHYTNGIREDGNIFKVFGKYENKLDFDTSDTFSETALFHSSSIVYRKSAFTAPGWMVEATSGDMVLYSVLSAAGPLRCIPEVMSVYRKHSNGVSSTDRLISRYHRDRIALMNRLNEYFDFRYDQKATSIIDLHKTALGLKKMAGLPELPANKPINLISRIPDFLKKVLAKIFG